MRLFSGDGMEGGKRGVFVSVLALRPFSCHYETDVCCEAVNLQDLLLIRWQRQPSR